ncbi:MAG TPA: hypothetical protein VHT24_09890 [Pseudacidobacterium sp.]|jgi:hypothetical protein|nr:hypothetical protein [Pseudacidobacterium sp.]
MSPDIALDLKKEANALVGSTSLLDGIQEPIDLEAVREVLLRRMLQDMRGILDQLGFAYVSGGRGPGDLDYIYVPKRAIRREWIQPHSVWSRVYTLYGWSWRRLSPQ